MAYSFFLDGLELPIPPAKMETKIKNNNTTVKLINDTEINILNNPGLTEISFSICLPHYKYPFAKMWRPEEEYLEKLKMLKVTRKPFQFVVSRYDDQVRKLFSTNLKVSLEEYTIIEDAKEAYDLEIAIKLKQYRNFELKKIKIQNETATIEKTRPVENPPIKSEHTVVTGDTLWKISKKYLGDGSRYPEIQKLNSDKVENPNLIEVGWVLKLPEYKDTAIV